MVIKFVSGDSPDGRRATWKDQAGVSPLPFFLPFGEECWSVVREGKGPLAIAADLTVKLPTTLASMLDCLPACLPSSRLEI